MRRRDPGARRASLFALFVANAISMSGNVAALVAIPWFVLQTTGSATRTGVTAFMGLLPIVISGFFGGALVDRLGYRRTSIIADLASSVAVAAIPLLHTTVGLEFWQLLVLVFLGGLLDAPGGTARIALIPEAATRAGWSYERASGATAVVERGARLAGAPLAGLLIAAVGSNAVLWIDAGTFLISAAVIAIWIPATARAPREATGYLTELRAGYAFLRADRTLFVLVAVLTITNMLDSVSLVALPVYADEIYGSAISLGLMLGVVGAGSIIGALAFSAIGDKVSRRRVFSWGFLGTTFWYPVAVLFPPLGILLAAKLISGIASGPLNPVIDVVFFERVPEDMRGRVFGVTQATAWLAMPIGVLVAGPMLESFGLRPTLLATGALYLVTVLVAMGLPALRGLDQHVERGPVRAGSAAPAAEPHVPGP